MRPAEPEQLLDQTGSHMRHRPKEHPRAAVACLPLRCCDHMRQPVSVSRKNMKLVRESLDQMPYRPRCLPSESRGGYVSLFVPKSRCPHCGRNVRKPRDAKDFTCPHCGQPGPWASGDQIEAWEKERQARARYDQLLAQVSNGDAGASVMGDLRNVQHEAAYAPDELKKLNLGAWLKYVSLAVSDDIVTPEEDSHIGALVPALGLTPEDIQAANPEILDHLLIASINGGVLPE